MICVCVARLLQQINTNKQRIDEGPELELSRLIYCDFFQKLPNEYPCEWEVCTVLCCGSWSSRQDFMTLAPRSQVGLQLLRLEVVLLLCGSCVPSCNCCSYSYYSYYGVRLTGTSKQQTTTTSLLLVSKLK
jgi:hypothetical protein